MGVIAVEGIRQKSPVGLYEKERNEGNELRVDIYLHTSLILTYTRLEEGFDYSLLHSSAINALKEPAFLLEEIIKRIYDNVILNIKEHSSTDSFNKLVIRVSKLKPPLKGQTDRTYIEESFEL
jgi:dihydroneopterin aldolase